MAGAPSSSVARVQARVAVLRPPAGTSLSGLEWLEHAATRAPLQLVRAWPGKAGALTLELRGPDGQLVAARWPHDTAAPGPRAVARDGRVVRLHERGEDPELPGLAALVRDSGARLLVHRAGRRGVVGLADGTYAKAVRPARLAGLVLATRRAATLAGPFCVAEPVEIDERHGVLRCAALPGIALHDHLEDVAAAGAAGAALRALHEGTAPAGVAAHDSAAEAAVVNGWIERLTGSLVAPPGIALPALPGAAAAAHAAALAPRICARLADGPRLAAVPIHRDLHDKQILTDRGRVGFLDFDTLARGEPALDLANLLVHLDLRALQGYCSVAAARAAGDAVLAAYRPTGAVRARMAPYAAAAWLRLACVYAFRPVRPGLIEELLERARAGSVT